MVLSIEERFLGTKGDHKGPHSAPHHPRPYFFFFFDWYIMRMAFS